MYKVLIVDDEKPAREILRNLIRWEDTGFTIADLAKNGKDALRLYCDKKPDLVITDIQMPGMDGLELIRQIRLNNNEQKFVILSCHENFSYAREAIKMGVTDYLLKHFLTPEDLFAVLNKVKSELDIIFMSRLQADNSDRVTINEGKDIEYKRIPLKRIVFENLDEIKIFELIEKHKLDLFCNGFALICIVIDDYKGVTEHLDQVEEMNAIKSFVILMSNTLKTEHRGECFYLGEGEFVLILCIESFNSELQYISTCFGVSQKIKSIFINQYQVSLTVGISRGFGRISLARQKYQEAHLTVGYRMFYGNDKILFYQMHIVKNELYKPENVEQRVRLIRVEMEQDNIEKALDLVHSLYSNDIKGFMQFNYLRYVNSYMYNLIIEYMNKNQISYEQVFERDYLPIEEVESMETVDDIDQWFTNVLKSILRIRKTRATLDSTIIYSKRVRDIVDYVSKNYFRDIGLSQIADDLKLNKSYLCRLFKQEVGENFSDYLMELRIERAKQLINKNQYKLYEISKMSGFSNATQFSSTFKRVTGQSPSDYKCKMNIGV